jgi:CubicO group peptidase (beta-lactamase class C family)
MDVTRCAEALDELVPQILAVSQAPGVSIAIGHRDEIVWAKGYGSADLATGRPMTPDTVGPTGSDAKPYTAAAAMQLVKRGLIDLDEPVRPHLDGLPLVNPHGPREITLRDLLTHRSGLGTTFGFAGRALPPPLGEHLRRVFAGNRTDVYGGSLFPLWATPVGAHYQYSNTGLAVVGYLVERLNPDRVPFPEWVRRHVFAPLAMTSTCFPPAQHPDHVPADLLARRSTGYATLAGTHFVLPAIHIGDYPAGSALTTPSDHARFVLAMIGDGGPVLDADTAALMRTPQTGRGPDPTQAVGLVWNLFQPFDAAPYLGHGGEYFWGWSNFTRGWPTEGVSLVVATNQWHLADGGASDRPSVLAGRLVADVVTAWVNGIDPRPRCRPAAAQSYLAGLVVADRLIARIGATPLSDADTARIADAAIVAPGTPWDPAAFRVAIDDVGGSDGTVAGMAEVALTRVPAHLQPLVQRQIGAPLMSQLATQVI